MWWFLGSTLIVACALPAASQDARTCASAEDSSLIQNVRARSQGQKQAYRQELAPVWRHEQRHDVRRDHAQVTVSDTTDYRQDAAIYLQQALESSSGNNLVSRCSGLSRMSLAEVENRWLRHRHASLAQARAEGKLNLTLVEQEARSTFNSGLDSDRPVVIQDVVGQLEWPAATLWGQSRLVRRLHDQGIRIHSFYYPHWVKPVAAMAEETLGEYLDSDQSAQNLFVFASETSEDEHKRGSEILNIIRGDFTPHPKFAYPPEAKSAILAIDAIGSSHGFHWHGPVWQVQVEGYKMWHLLPPFRDHSEWGAAPLIDGKPFEHTNACAMLARFAPPPGTLRCLVAPGEMILLPTHWLHATCGLSNYTAAAGGWL